MSKYINDYSLVRVDFSHSAAFTDTASTESYTRSMVWCPDCGSRMLRSHSTGALYCFGCFNIFFMQILIKERIVDDTTA